jgi:branched-chain amino acid transport system permease protein
MYAFLAVLSLLWLITFRQILYSQLGRAFLAIRENEDRASSIGYNVQMVKLKAFIISGGITGLAGGLYALYLGYSNASHMHWSNSGDFLFIVLIGGTFNFLGAFVGSAVFRGLNFFLSHIEWWPLIVGTILIITVHYAPSGILGLIEDEE